LLAPISLIKLLYSHGWKKYDIISLITFIDWVLVLPEDLELQCREAVGAIEEELHVRYVTSFERIAKKEGVQQGIEQGLQQGERTMLLMQLERKFTTIPERYRRLIEQAEASTLLHWGSRVLDCQSLDDMFSE
jgi:flagellar biosynthesis/type III secretory pathway protein FliH